MTQEYYLPDKDDAPWLHSTYDAFMTHEEMLEAAERRERSNVVLSRYNAFYNNECASLPHGTPITPEHQQMITLQCMIDALRCENLNREYNEIAISDIEDLIARLDEQATEYLERTRKEYEEFGKLK
jgi:hypothetical protein